MFSLQQTNQETQPTQKKGRSTWIIIAITSLLVIIVSAFYFDTPTDAEKIELQNLEERMAHGERLQDWEKEKFVKLLWAVKGIRLFTCMVRQAHQPYLLV
ncbi:MAG TPA: hypothetical protein PLX69_25370 [Leptospiraceae bacterium]|nr:hypothetical protein [Leptospiraceae bacterium]HRG77916.1 hypothetical protein [Leptospiraceae bacterium]